MYPILLKVMDSGESSWVAMSKEPRTSRLLTVHMSYVFLTAAQNIGVVVIHKNVFKFI